MTHEKVRYSDFAVIDAILVRLNHSENYHTGIYYYFTCFICADISRQSELLLPQIMSGYRGFLSLLFGTSLALIRRSLQEKQAKIRR